jgi:hypothetical protein
MLAVALLVLLKQALLHALAECCGKEAEMMDKSTAKCGSCAMSAIVYPT